jgi:hypothetical protein
VEIVFDKFRVLKHALRSMKFAAKSFSDLRALPPVAIMPFASASSNRSTRPSTPCCS